MTLKMEFTFDLSKPEDHELFVAVAQVLGAVPQQMAAIGEISKAAETEAAVTDKPKRRGRAPKVDGPIAEAERVNPPPVQEAPAPVTIEGEAEDAEGDESMADEIARDEPPPPAPTSKDDLKAAMGDFIAAKGVPAAVEVLRQFNASRLSEVKDEDVAAVTKAMRDALAATADPWA